jgi:hypothetical protein
MNKTYSFVFLKKSQRLQEFNFESFNQTKQSVKIQEKPFFKDFENRNFKLFPQIYAQFFSKIAKKKAQSFKIFKFQKFGQKKNFFYGLFETYAFSNQSLILCSCKRFLKKQIFALNETMTNCFFEILNNFNGLRKLQTFFLKLQFFSKIFQKKIYTILQMVNIQKFQKKFFEKKNYKTLFFYEFFKSSKNFLKTLKEHFFSNTIFFTPKFKFLVFFFFLEIQFSLFSNFKNLKKIQRETFFQTFSKNFTKSFSIIEFLEKTQNQKSNVLFYDQNFLKSQNIKKSKNNKIKVAKKQKKCFQTQKCSKKILVFIFSWAFALVNKNLYFSNLPLQKLSNFQSEKLNFGKKREQSFFEKKMVCKKQKTKQKTSFLSSKKVDPQSFDLRIKYSQIHLLNSLNLFTKSVEFFNSFLSLCFMNLSEHWNHFQLIYHQYLKFHFLNIQMQLQKNQFFFGNFVSFQQLKQLMLIAFDPVLSRFGSCFLKKNAIKREPKNTNEKNAIKKLCGFSGLAFLHFIPVLFQKPFGFLTKQNLQIFLKKNFQKVFSFFFNSIQQKNKTVQNFTFLKYNDFEKNYFHLCQSLEAKVFKKKFSSFFVFLFKKKFLTGQKFSFQNSNFENCQKKPIFFLWQNYFSNFLLFNSTLLCFFKRISFFKKIFVVFGNFFVLKTSFCSIYTHSFYSILSSFFSKNMIKNAKKKTGSKKKALKKYRNQKKILKKNFFGFFTQPFYHKIIQIQKEKRNIISDQNIFWQISKKFLFFPTQIQNLNLFHLCPLASDFLMLSKKSMPLFLSQTSQIKSFLSFVSFVNQKHIPQLSILQKNQRKTDFFLNTKKEFLKSQKKHMFKTNKKFCFQKLFKTKLLLKDEKQQQQLLHQKKSKKIFFQTRFFQKLKFDCFSVSLWLNYKKQLKYFYNFEKKPTYENIQNHLNQCKQIVEKSIGQKQLNFMKKLHKKIQNWSKKYKTTSSQKMFKYCDSTLLKFLWNWARKTHPNKSKGWIRKKYFVFFYSQQWFFGKKTGKIFICLPLHSQTKLQH